MPLVRELPTGKILEWVNGGDCPILEVEEQETVAAILSGLRFAKRLHKAGIDPPTRILMSGPTGTGKTLTARWLGEQIGIPTAIARLDKVVEGHLGATAALMRSMFEEAKQRPCLLFLDEVDGISQKRGKDDSAAAKEMDRATSSLLQQFDEIDPCSVVVAATNIPNALDPALRRRFTIEIKFSLPSEASRRAMLDAWLATAELPADMIAALVEGSAGLSGAALRARAMDLARRFLISRWEREDVAANDREGTIRRDFEHAFPGDPWPGYTAAEERCVDAAIRRARRGKKG